MVGFLPVAVDASSSFGTSGGAGGAGVPRMLSSTNRPRFTGEVRVGFEVTVRMLAWVSSPPRCVPSSETRFHSLPEKPPGTLIP